MIGITSYGAYIPLWRLKREAISQGGRGEKSVSNFDEDSLTMAVSATINSFECVSKVEMSPLTAKLKCPHGTGEDTHGAKTVTEVAPDEDGKGREDHLEGGE